MEGWEIYWGAQLEKIWKHWEALVAQTEFAYNYVENRTTSKSPFEVIYGQQPMDLYVLAPLQKMGRDSLKGKNMANLVKKTAWRNQIEDGGVE